MNISHGYDQNNDGQKEIISRIINKEVLFISSKEINYIRNHQEIELIKKYAKNSRIFAYKDKSMLLRLAKIYTRLFLIIFQKKPQVIFVGFAPQLVWPFIILHFFSPRSDILIDFFISFFDTLVYDRKIVSDKSIMSRIIHFIDATTLQKADLVIADTRSHANYFIQEFHLHKKQLVHLYLQPDISVYYPRPQMKPKEWEGKFVILYFGSILPLQGIDVILESCSLLQNEKQLLFVIIGPIGKNTKTKFSQSNLVFIPWLPQKQLADCIACADLCLAGHFNAEISKAKRTIAGKAFIYKAMGKPVIFGDNEANREIFSDQEPNNYFIPMGNPQALADCIRTIYVNRINNQRLSS